MLSPVMCVCVCACVCVCVCMGGLPYGRQAGSPISSILLISQLLVQSPLGLPVLQCNSQLELLLLAQLMHYLFGSSSSRGFDTRMSWPATAESHNTANTHQQWVALPLLLFCTTRYCLSSLTSCKLQGQAGRARAGQGVQGSGVQGAGTDPQRH